MLSRWVVMARCRRTRVTWVRHQRLPLLATPNNIQMNYLIQMLKMTYGKLDCVHLEHTSHLKCRGLRSKRTWWRRRLRQGPLISTTVGHLRRRTRNYPRNAIFLRWRNTAQRTKGKPRWNTAYVFLSLKLVQHKQANYLKRNDQKYDNNKIEQRKIDV